VRQLLIIAVGVPAILAAQEPRGLARAALDHPAFTWIRADAPHLRIHFLADSHAAFRRDSLRSLTERARAHDLALLGAERFDADIDVFFVESRAQMDSLVGFPVTGFAHREARAVFLVNNPDWRSFERHELMHVLAHHVWGPAAAAWIEEGLAQFADGRCGGYAVSTVAHALGARGGYVPFDTLAARFRELNDLTAYLQAASMVEYLYQTYGREAVRAVWRGGVAALREVTGRPPSALGELWRAWVAARARPVPDDQLATIRRKGCG
jgi:hypothetical protein